MITPRLPVRAFGLAALLALVGAGLGVAGEWAGWPVFWPVLGAVLMVAGFALLAWAYVAARRQRVTIHLADDGYRIVEPTGERAGTWAQVSRLTGAPGVLTLHLGDDERVQLVTSPDKIEALDAVASDIGRRLDADRGYRTLS